MLISNTKIRDAIRFATETHEIYQKQKRKGKDVPYITHPLTVGIILAQVGAEDDVIAAGILHDTIEDSIPEKKVTKERLEESFNKNIAELVLSVTEQDKRLSWEKRKKEALEHIKNFSNDSLLVKSADISSNISDLIDDYERDGEKTFECFNAPKEKVIKNYLQVIQTITECWQENPLKGELMFLASQLQVIENKK